MARTSRSLRKVVKREAAKVVWGQMWQASTAEWENETESANQSFLSSVVHGTFVTLKLCLQHVTYSIPNSMYPLESETSWFTKKPYGCSYRTTEFLGQAVMCSRKFCIRKINKVVVCRYPEYRGIHCSNSELQGSVQKLGSQKEKQWIDRQTSGKTGSTGFKGEKRERSNQMGSDPKWQGRLWQA